MTNNIDFLDIQLDSDYEKIANCLMNNATGIFEVPMVFGYISKKLHFNKMNRQPNKELSLYSLCEYLNETSRQVAIKSVAFLHLSNIIKIKRVSNKGFTAEINTLFVKELSKDSFNREKWYTGPFCRQNTKRLKLYLNHIDSIKDVTLQDIVKNTDEHRKNAMCMELLEEQNKLKVNKKEFSDRSRRSQNPSSDRSRRSPMIVPDDHAMIVPDDHRTHPVIVPDDHIRDLETKRNIKETKKCAQADRANHGSLVSGGLEDLPEMTFEGDVGIADEAVPGIEGSEACQTAVMVDSYAKGESTVDERATHNRIDSLEGIPRVEEIPEKSVEEKLSDSVRSASLEMFYHASPEEEAYIASVSDSFVFLYMKALPPTQKLNLALLNDFKRSMPHIVFKLVKEEVTLKEIESLVYVMSHANQYQSKIGFDLRMIDLNKILYGNNFKRVLGCAFESHERIQRKLDAPLAAEIF